jgi:hypothetical protein
LLEQLFIGTGQDDQLANAPALQGKHGPLKEAQSSDVGQWADVGKTAARAITEETGARQQDGRAQSLQFRAPL